MATQKQIQANRKNAKQSTGPQTPDGKEIVAQNALKHGLTAQKPLIPGEDPAHFAQFNDSMLAQFDPQGPLETILANRIITLTWQLNRAPRIQAAAFKFMMKDVFDPPCDPEERLGKTIVRDIASDQTPEKLQAYEQRIENNLYKTIDKLEQIQLIRKNNPPAPQPTHKQQPTNQELPTTNSIPQNKPNSEIKAPRKMSSRPKKCEAIPDKKPSQPIIPPQPAKNELRTTNSFGKTKPILTKP